MLARRPAVLPALRPDLRLLDGGRDATGEPTFLIFDAARHRYFHIGWHAFEMLARWSSRTHDALKDRLRRELALEVDDQEVDALVGFLDAQELTVDGATTGWRRSLILARSRRAGIAKWLLHNYLFFRIPLVRPDRWLSRAARVTSVVFTRAFWIAWACLALAAVYLASREWADFTAAWGRVFEPQGMLAFAGGLVILKSIHELGHALVAKRLGCRVASMGVAFMVLTPILYTDTTDAWRLPSRRLRLRIASAGVLAELIVAPLALLVWAFMTTGFLRDFLFSAAVLAPALSLAVNLNPFMRFDGYFMLSDALGMYNLQPRSFALGRWKLREALFAHREPPPEHLPRPLERLLIAYAYGTWVYRLLLFIAIAVFVYYFFIKIVGIVLFIIEIGYFVARPVAAEMVVWWRLRDRIRLRWWNVMAWGAIAMSLLALVLPWQTAVRVPAIVEASRLEAVHPPASGRVAEVMVKNGDVVAAGQPLVRLEAAELEAREAMALRRIALIELRLARSAGDAADLEQSLILEQERATEVQALAGIRRLRQDLVVKAPVAGTVVDLDKDLRPGLWLAPRHQIAVLVGSSSVVLRGLVSQADVERLEAGMTGSFVADDGVHDLARVRVESVSRAADRRLSLPLLAEPYGGRIEAVIDEKKAVYSHEAMFSVRMVLDSDETVAHLLRGVAIIEGEPRSIAMRVLRRVGRVLVQEMGF